MFHLLGIDPHGVFHDKENRPHPLTKGEPIAAMLVDPPSPIKLRTAEGDVAFVPPFDTRLLFDTDFDTDLRLVPVEPPTREKGWRGWPIRTPTSAALTVNKSNGAVELGYGSKTTAERIALDPGGRALLAQEIRNARGGHYTLKVRASGAASSGDEYETRAVARMARPVLVLKIR